MDDEATQIPPEFFDAFSEQERLELHQRGGSLNAAQCARLNALTGWELKAPVRVFVKQSDFDAWMQAMGADKRKFSQTFISNELNKLPQYIHSALTRKL